MWPHLPHPHHHHHNPPFSCARDLILFPARHAKLDRTTVRDALYLRVCTAVAQHDEKVSWL